jgi:hypothetical protein
MTGIIDIEAEWNGNRVFIDLKYSALINDKWSETGWATETLSDKRKLMVQGIHYKLLAKESMGIENIPFYYFVFSSTNPKDAKIILQNVDDDKIEKHRLDVNVIRDLFQKELKRGLKPRPSYNKCNGCYLFENCKHRIEVPTVEIIGY